MNEPWTWTTMWELTVGVGVGMGGGGQSGKNWDNCNRTKKKIKRAKSGKYTHRP